MSGFLQESTLKVNFKVMSYHKLKNTSKLLQNLRVLWQYSRILHLQVNTFFKYWVNLRVLSKWIHPYTNISVQVDVFKYPRYPSIIQDICFGNSKCNNASSYFTLQLYEFFRKQQIRFKGRILHKIERHSKRAYDSEKSILSFKVIKVE